MNIIESHLELNNYNDDLPLFTLNDQIHLAKVVKCYDGDTIHCIFKHDGKYQKFNVRLYGYDSPEMKPPKSLPNRDIEMNKAKLAKKRLEELLLNKNIYLFCGEFDKYGRLLATVKLNINDNKTINDMMIEEGHGYPYFGGTKQSNNESLE